MHTNSTFFVFVLIIAPHLVHSLHTSQPRLAQPTTKPLLRDASFRCCALLSDPIVFRNPTRAPFGYDGLVIDFVLRLQEATGFRCSSFKEFQDATGTGWNKFVHNVAACSDENGTIANNEHCQCDLGIGAWFENPARSHVAFLPPVAIDDMRMAVHLNQTTTSSSTIFFINAFHPYVWAATAALMICFTIVKLFDTRFVSVTPQYNPSPDRSCNATSILRQLKHKLLKGRVFFRTRRAIQSTLLKMIGHSSTFRGEDKSIRHWVLNFSICLCGLILVLIYEATMTALLVQENRVSAYQTIADLENCKIPDEDICFVQGDYTELFWNSVLKQKECRKNSNKKPKTYPSYTELISRVSKGDCIYVMADGGNINTAVNGRYCQQLVSTGQPFGRRGTAMITPHNWPYFEEMRRATLQIIESNAVPSSTEEYFERLGLCEISSTPQLSFSKLRVFFIITVGACAVVLAQMLIDPQKPLHDTETTSNHRQSDNASETDTEADMVSALGEEHMDKFMTQTTDEIERGRSIV